MSWHPNDLVSDYDLLAYEQQIRSAFDVVDWRDRRQKALEDWLFPLIATQGLDPDRLRTRVEPDQVWGYTGGAYSDLTSAAANATTDDVALASVWATPATDALYIGSAKPFRGLSVRMLDSVSSASATLTIALWCDVWQAVSISDATMRTAGKTLSGGGPVTWSVPSDWVVRAIAGSASLYYAKVTVSATPTGATASQIGVIRRSVLCAPATFRTLELIFREAPTSQDGPWREKAEYYAQQAELAWQRALPLLGREFDTDEDDVIDGAERTQTTEVAGAGGWTWERM